MAVQKKAAHFTGIHLFDDKNRIYNIPFIEKYFHGKGIIVHLANRSQGILYREEITEKPTSIEDIARRKLSFVNRQIGAGTRMMFDFLLKSKGINKTEIIGYNNIVNTHIDAGYIVKEGFADTAIALEYIAHMLGLGFIPLFNESYDLYFPDYFLEDDRFNVILDLLKKKKIGDTLKDKGYDLSKMGEIIYEG